MGKPTKHRIAGINAKAGSRKVYGHIVRNPKTGDIISGQRQMKSVKPSRGYEMKQTTGLDVHPPSSKVLNDQLEKLRKLQNRQHTNHSDPFIYERMRAHIKIGILEL